MDAREFSITYRQRVVDIVASLALLNPNTIRVEVFERKSTRARVTIQSQYSLLVTITVTVFSSWLDEASKRLISGSPIQAQLIINGIYPSSIGQINVVAQPGPEESTNAPCEPGTELKNGKCEACSPGSFSNVNSSMICMPCPENKYSPVTRSASCLDCPSGKDSDAGATQCQDSDNKVILITVLCTLIPVAIIAISSYLLKEYICECIKKKNTGGSS
jgi:hypothetical protein